MITKPAMSQRPILDDVRTITESFSSTRLRKRTKLTGALAIEVLRDYFHKAGVSVSTRDVFIRGNPTEFDALIVRPTASPLYGIVYEPMDVAAILEIKFSGVYSKESPMALKECFDNVRAKHPHIECVYITICENPRVRFHITTAMLGYPAFTLYWVNSDWTSAKEPGDSMHSIIACLQNALRQLPAVSS